MVRPAPAASRAVSILDYLIAHPTGSFTLSELARANDLNIASTQTVLAVLTDAGYVRRQPSRKTYALGPMFVAAGHVAAARNPAIDAATEEIRRLSRDLGVELLLTVPAGGDIVAVARAGRPNPRGLDVGQRIPLVPPLGAVFIAWGDQEEVRAWLDASDANGSRESARNRRALESVQARGYSVTVQPASDDDSVADAIAAVADRPSSAARRHLESVIRSLGRGAYHLDDLRTAGPHRIRMIAAPVFDEDGRVVLAISLNDLPGRLSSKEVVAWGTRLRDLGLVVTRRTRGRPPDGTTFAR